MNHRILVVEDEIIVAMDIQQRLENMNCVVVGIVSSGEQAIQIAEMEKPDLVLMDVKLRGEIDGIQAAEIIRQRYGLPVIILTAFADEATLERAQITEAYDYILKPFEERELATNIGIAIYKHQMENKLLESEKRYRLIAESMDDVNRTLEQRVRERTAQIELSRKQLVGISYSIAHTLLTPLRAVNDYGHILLNNYASLIDSQGKECLNHIREASGSMSQKVDGLLILLKISGNPLEIEAVDLSLLAQNVIEALKLKQPERMVEFVFPPELFVEADKTMMAMLVEQLLDDAWKFTRHQALAKIEMGIERQDGRDIYFVRDNGIGFDLAYREQLFNLFQQLNPPDEYEGAGIGLAIAQHIMQRHEGKIWATGEVGKGMTIYFGWPKGNG